MKHMKYVRTKDGRIVDLQKFIDKEKANPYYKNHRFSKIKQNGDLDYSAIGTDENTIAKQVGKRCYFQASLNSEIISQADTIEELCDYWDYFDSIFNEYKTQAIYFYTLNEMKLSLERNYIRDVKLAIRTDKGLIYVAKMNEKGELELL